MALVGFGLVLNKERFPKLAYGLNIALLTFPIVAIPGRSSASHDCISNSLQQHASCTLERLPVKRGMWQMVWNRVCCRVHVVAVGIVRLPLVMPCLRQASAWRARTS